MLEIFHADPRVHNRVKRAYSIKVIPFIPQSRFQTRRRTVKRAHDAFPHLCADNAYQTVK